MIQALFNREDFKKESDEFRIGAVISDGMWYSVTKWRKISRVSEEAITEWIERNLKSGRLMQSSTGAKSYRFPLWAIKEWYSENNLDLNVQLIDFLFPPRIWDGMTETEGFLKAPLREIGVVSFSCDPKVATEVIQSLRGIARVREVEPNCYKSYALDSNYVKKIIEDIFKKYSEQEKGKIYSRSVARRRELSDFSNDFSHGLILFYKNFGKSLVKGSAETINIFLPDLEDQETQVIMWVITAVEKFDESTSVPFSGYLNSVLKRWPYDLPYEHLGKELSNFQRHRSRAITALKLRTGKTDFTIPELLKEIDYDRDNFHSLEEKHSIWLRSRTPTTLTWAENSEEKSGQNVIQDLHRRSSAVNDLDLANKISFAILKTAIKTENWSDAFSLIEQVDANNINIAKIKEVSEDFIQELAVEIGLNDSSIIPE